MLQEQLSSSEEIKSVPVQKLSISSPQPISTSKTGDAMKGKSSYALFDRMLWKTHNLLIVYSMYFCLLCEWAKCNWSQHTACTRIWKLWWSKNLLYIYVNFSFKIVSWSGIAHNKSVTCKERKGYVTELGEVSRSMVVYTNKYLSKQSSTRDSCICVLK